MDLRELTFDQLEVGRVYVDRRLTVSPELVRSYVQAVGTDNALYSSDEVAQRFFGRPIAPPTLPVIWTPPRVSFEGWAIPQGGVHAAQEWESLRPVRPGDSLRLRTSVGEKFLRRERLYVVFDSVFENDRGEVVARGRITAVWPR